MRCPRALPAVRPQAAAQSDQGVRDVPEAKKTGTPMDESGHGCLFWIAWKVGGIAVILLLGAALPQ